MADRARSAGRAEGVAAAVAHSSTGGEVARDRIVFLGHATVLIELDGVRLLTDPLLRDRVAHLRRQVPPLDPTAYAGIDAVLISHLHHDHLDLASLRLLGRELPLLVPAGAGELLRGSGFSDVGELRAGESANVGALTVTAVQARHDGRRRPGPRGQRAETLGYVMSGRRRTVYFAGDTELFEGMASTAPARDPQATSCQSPAHDLGTIAPRPDDGASDQTSRLDVALLPVAGWGPTLGAGHMDPLDAARAARLIRPRIVIPMHWGTLLPIGLAGRHVGRLGDPPRIFAEHVASLAPGVEVRILEPGQETAL
jgi:L-ascorbate metabolism protein UlaG (beta-lactamase superfamily)